MSDQEIITFVLDNPNEAAEELERLRKMQSDLITELTAALSQLDAPMPTGLELMALAGQYAERSGYAIATIRGALADLKLAQK